MSGTTLKTREMRAREQQQMRRWHIYHDPRDLIRHAQRAILGAAAEALSRRGRFDLAISGGPALECLFGQFRDREIGDARWHIWFTDERCLPDGHPEKFETRIRDMWLGHSRVPGENIHGIGCAGAPEEAAGRYLESLQEVECFDLVLLAMGPDGQTAGLFPGQGLAEFDEAPDVLAVHAPETPSARITLSAGRLGATRQLVLLVSGEDKRRAVGLWRAGEGGLPVSRLRPGRGIDVFADEAAVPGF